MSLYCFIAPQQATVREEPQKNSRLLTKLEKGTAVKIIENAKYYYKIYYFDEKTKSWIEGWIPKRSVEKNIKI